VAEKSEIQPTIQGTNNKSTATEEQNDSHTTYTDTPNIPSNREFDELKNQVQQQSKQIEDLIKQTQDHRHL